MATWPSTLPDPLKNYYSYKPGSSVIRSDMDSGLARQRRRFTSRIDLFKCALVLSSTQLQTLETFIDDDIDGGAAWFDIYLKDGQGKRLLEARLFQGQLDNVRLIGTEKWQIDFQIEVRNR